jgi:hypothetical protein
MRRRRDAFDVLKANNPVDEASLPTAESQKARALLAEITATSREMPTSTSRPIVARRHLVIAVAAMATTLIAATWLILRPVADPISVACYQATSLDSAVVAVASGGTLDTDLCTLVWEEGTLVNPAVAPEGEVPPLVGCVSESGSLAVFPSDDRSLCGQLGLAEPDPASIPAGDVVRDLNDKLVAYFVSHECVPVDDAKRDVTQILADSGLSDWHVQSLPGTPDRPCASFALAVDTKTIELIPIPRPR